MKPVDGKTARSGADAGAKQYALPRMDCDAEAVAFGARGGLSVSSPDEACAARHGRSDGEGIGSAGAVRQGEDARQTALPRAERAERAQSRRRLVTLSASH
jgi:hypothetical protein